MTSHNHPQNGNTHRVLGVILFAYLFTAPTLGVTATVKNRGAGRFSQAANVRAKIRAYEQKLTQTKLRPGVLNAPGKQTWMLPATLGETSERTFLRQPFVAYRRGVPEAIRRHNAVLLLAHELGRAELVPVSTKLKLPSDMPSVVGRRHFRGEIHERTLELAGKEIMAVADIGADFVSLGEADSSVVNKISEETRITGALLHLLSWQLDGTERNVFVVEKTGDVALIDFDVALGALHTHPGIDGSVFFKSYSGRSLAYTSEQKQVTQLPLAAQRLVTTITKSSSDELIEAFGLERDEARMMRRAARWVVEHGLDGAVERFRQEFPRLWKSKDQQRAERDQAAAATTK